jgi:hypothetical protein
MQLLKSYSKRAEIYRELEGKGKFHLNCLKWFGHARVKMWRQKLLKSEYRTAFLQIYGYESKVKIDGSLNHWNRKLIQFTKYSFHCMLASKANRPFLHTFTGLKMSSIITWSWYTWTPFSHIVFLQRLWDLKWKLWESYTICHILWMFN